MFQQDFEIDAHPNGDQEEAQAEPPERRCDDLDFTTVIGLGDHDSRDEGAEDGGEAHSRCHKACDDHDEQAGAEEELRTFGAGSLREQDRQEEPPEKQHGNGCHSADQHRPEQGSDRVPAGLRRHCPEQEDDRHQCKVFEKEHCQRCPADGLCVPTSGSTSAVEERARASPRPIDPATLCPVQYKPRAMIAADTISSADPVPNTRRRMLHKRLNESSRPIAKRRSTIPSSAKGSIASGLEIVT